MDDQNTAQSTGTTATTTTTATPAAMPGNTPATAVNVDIDAIAAKASEQAEKKMEAVFKSMLQQQGLDTETINKMATEWKASQRTPEQTIRERDEEIVRLKGELDLTKNERIAAGKGIPDEMIPDYVRLALGYEGKDFTEKLDAAIKKFPLEKPAVAQPYATGTGTGAAIGADDAFAAKLKKYTN